MTHSQLPSTAGHVTAPDMSKASQHCNIQKLDNGFLDIRPTMAQNSPLLNLPPEIRLMIWEYALSGNTISPTVWHDGANPKPALFLQMVRSINGIRPSTNRFALLRICRQIYAEAAALPYLLSTFRFYTSDDLRFWLKRILAHMFAMLRFVEFECMNYVKTIELKRWKRFIKRLPGLKELHVKVCLASLFPGRSIASHWHLGNDRYGIKLAEHNFSSYRKAVGQLGQVALTYKVLPGYKSWKKVVKGTPRSKYLVSSDDEVEYWRY